MGAYVWIGGYTGFTGVGSGWSGSYGGVIGRQMWTSTDGLTSDKGDYFYSPYNWSLRQNWVEWINNSPCYADPQWSSDEVPIFKPALRVPAGNDTVLFVGGPFTAGWNTNTNDVFNYPGVTWRGEVCSGQTPNNKLYGGWNTKHISCLYGSMSSDGLTHSGSTAWNTTLAGAAGTAARYGAIDIISFAKWGGRVWAEAPQPYIGEPPTTTPGYPKVYDIGRLGKPDLPLKIRGMGYDNPYTFIKGKIGINLTNAKCSSVQNCNPKKSIGGFNFKSVGLTGDPYLPNFSLYGGFLQAPEEFVDLWAVTGAYTTLDGYWTNIAPPGGNVIVKSTAGIMWQCGITSQYGNGLGGYYGRGGLHCNPAVVSAGNFFIVEKGFKIVPEALVTARAGLHSFGSTVDLNFEPGSVVGGIQIYGGKKNPTENYAVRIQSQAVEDQEADSITINNLHVQAGSYMLAGATGNELRHYGYAPANVNINSSRIKTLTVLGGNINVDRNATIAASDIRVETGFIRPFETGYWVNGSTGNYFVQQRVGSSINMSNSGVSNWRDFNLGLTALGATSTTCGIGWVWSGDCLNIPVNWEGDDLWYFGPRCTSTAYGPVYAGLRIDGNDIPVKGYRGQSVRSIKNLY